MCTALNKSISGILVAGHLGERHLVATETMVGVHTTYQFRDNCTFYITAILNDVIPGSNGLNVIFQLHRSLSIPFHRFTLHNSEMAITLQSLFHLLVDFNEYVRCLLYYQCSMLCRLL